MSEKNVNYLLAAIVSHVLYLNSNTNICSSVKPGVQYGLYYFILENIFKIEKRTFLY